MFDACVIGLGRIGLPTALLMADAGLTVLGVDTDERLLADLEAGAVVTREPGLQELFDSVRASGRMTVRARPDPAMAYVVAVPTPIDEAGACDVSAVREAIEAIAGVAPRGSVVMVESTVPPGTVAGPLAELLAARGLVPGIDISLAHCPERALPGHTLTEIRENPRLIGGVTESCARAAAQIYRRFVRAEPLLTTATAAETVKLFENAFRDVNIALANEFAGLCVPLGLPPRETIALANLHPRVTIHDPGIGVGGHCIPVDPLFLAQIEPRPTLVSQARHVNDGMPGRIAEAIAGAASARGARRVALLGLAYRADTDDMRNSPALEVARHLAGAEKLKVVAYDPAGDVEGARCAPSLEAAVEGAELVVILVGHAEFSASLAALLPTDVPVLDFSGRAGLAGAEYPLGRAGE